MDKKAFAFAYRNPDLALQIYEEHFGDLSQSLEKTAAINWGKMGQNVLNFGQKVWNTPQYRNALIGAGAGAIGGGLMGGWKGAVGGALGGGALGYASPAAWNFAKKKGWTPQGVGSRNHWVNRAGNAAFRPGNMGSAGHFQPWGHNWGT